MYRAVICVEFTKEDGYEPEATAQTFAEDLANHLGRGYNVWLDDVLEDDNA